MPATTFRILDQAPQYLLDDGSLNAGGFLYTFQTDLTTPKVTYSDPGATTPNANPIELDAAGRVPVDIWGDGAYGLELRDADDVVIWTRNNVEIPGGAATSIPSLVNGYFLTNDGSNLLWAEIANQLVPDPSGLANYYLSSDGTGTPIWQQFPTLTPPDPEIAVTANKFQAGVSTDTTKWLEQTGSGSASASSGKTATASITFPTAFAAAPTFVDIVPTTTSACAAANLIPGWAITAKSTTGFTVTFSTITGGTSADGYTGSNITGSLSFDWKATGTVTVTP